MIRKIAQRTGLALAALAAIVSATGQARATILNFDDLIWATSLNSGNSNLTAQVHNMLDPTSTVTTSPANFTMGIYQLTSVSGVSPNRKALVTLLNSNAYDGFALANFAMWPSTNARLANGGQTSPDNQYPAFGPLPARGDLETALFGDSHISLPTGFTFNGAELTNTCLTGGSTEWLITGARLDGGKYQSDLVIANTGGVFTPYDFRVNWPNVTDVCFHRVGCGATIFVDDVRCNVAAAPEPSTLALLGVAGVGPLVYAWRRHQPNRSRPSAAGRLHSASG